MRSAVGGKLYEWALHYFLQILSCFQSKLKLISNQLGKNTTDIPHDTTLILCIAPSAIELSQNVSYIDFRPNTPRSLALLVAGRTTLGGGSLWYPTDCGTVQTMLLGAVRCHVPAQPAAQRIFSNKWSCRLGGIECVYV